MFGFISEIMSSANRASAILSLILRISAVFLTGYDLGTGVEISYLYSFGYSPRLILVLIMSARGSARYAENDLVSLGGKSPWTVALLIFSWVNWSHTREGAISGISSGKKGGKEMSSVFSSSNSFGIDVNLSAIFSAWFWSDKWLISSMVIRSPFWSYEVIFLRQEYHCPGFLVFRSSTVFW